MRPKDLEGTLRTTPFIPFDIHVDGKTIHVGHPEQVLLTVSKTTAVIVPGDDIHIVSIPHISSISLRRRPRTPSKGT